MMTDCSTPVFGDGFFVAREYASDVHLGTSGSPNHKGTDHWLKLAVQANASCQNSDTHDTIDNSMLVSPSSLSTLLLHCH